MTKTMTGILLITMLSFTAMGKVVYVNANAPSEGDGSSWQNACQSINNAAAVASPGDSLWIAKGIYKRITQKVTLPLCFFGGFSGTETSFDQRDWKTNKTIVTRTAADSSGFIFYDSAGICIDGITFQKLAGVLTSLGVISANYYAKKSTIRNCSFIECCVPIVPNFNDTMFLESCSFTKNYSSYEGGCINNTFGATVVARECTFNENYAKYQGSILHQDFKESKVFFSKCTFTKNSSVYSAGCMLIENGMALIKECTFSEDSCGYEGGVALCGNKDSVRFEDCSFINNKAGHNSAIVHGDATFTGCLFSGSTSYLAPSAVWGGVFINCTFTDHTTTIGENCQKFTGCTFTNNKSLFVYSRLTEFRNCLFSGNGVGYAIEPEHTGYNDQQPGFNTSYINCRFVDNRIPVICVAETTTVTGCVIVQNRTRPFYYIAGRSIVRVANSTVTGSDTLIHIERGTMNITSSIFWSNSSQPITNTPTRPVCNYSCINYDSIALIPGDHNINRNPQFRNTFNGNLRLSSRSPCIDAGFGDTTLPIDLDGVGRYDLAAAANTGGGSPVYADIGAYELAPGPLGFAPEFISAAIDTTWPESLFTYTAEAIDPDNDPVTISFPGLPAWLSLSANTISGRIKKTTRDTLVAIIASDGKLFDTLVLQIHNPEFINNTDGTWTIYDSTNGLPANAITCLAVSGKSVWAGTRKGLAVLNDGTWTVYTMQNCSIPSNTIEALCPDMKNGGMLVATETCLSRVKNGVWQSSKLFMDLNPMSDLYLGLPICIAQTSAGTIYVGGYGYPGGSGDTYGLATVNPPAGCSIYQKWPSDRSLYRVTAAAALPDGGIWLSGPTVASGMVFVEHQYYFIDKSNTWVNNTSTISTQTEITELEYNARTGELWRGEEKGYTKGAVTIDSLADLEDPYITALAFDSTGNAWVGTDTGLVILLKGGPNSKRYVLRDGLPSLRITAIEVAPDGTIWIGTGNGLVSLSYNGSDPIIHDQVIVKKPSPLSCFASGRHIVFSRSVPVGSCLRLFNLCGRQIATAPVNGKTAELPYKLGAGMFLWQVAEKQAVVRGKILLR